MGRSSERNIYLVVGSTGEGADCQSWSVAAYDDEAAAAAHVAELHEAIGGEWRRTQNRQAIKEELRESGLDPHCLIDYTGAGYSVEAIPLRTLPPKTPLGPRSRPSLLAEHDGLSSAG